jgi:hypothetical protein
MITKKEKITMDNFMNGDVAARFEMLIEEAMDNMLDLNYDGSTRKVQIQVEFTPNERRDEAKTKVKYKCDKGKIIMPVITVAIGRNAAGRAEGREFITRQQELFNQGVTPIRQDLEAGIKD